VASGKWIRGNLEKDVSDGCDYGSKAHIRDQIGLEFIKINIKRTIEAKRCGDRRNDLSDQAVQVHVTWSADADFLFANVVYGFVVNL
jgi:hypothetical protein